MTDLSKTELIEAYIRRYGASTRREISNDLGIDINSVCSIVQNLLNRKAIVEKKSRPCYVTGFNAKPLSIRKK